MKSKITIKIINLVTKDVLKEFNGMDERKADRVYNGLCQKTNLDKYDLQWVVEGKL
tara:strand:- start:1871 stop:2038 length:168 start_codon:yes stop_codon:yes gene_type:complete